jgi:nucleoid-associated protein YgaU
MLGNLFDFAKHIGRKVFDTDAEAADDIRNYIQASNPGVDSLKVAFDDGTVTLAGRAIDQAAKEKVVLMAGNVKGVERVEADAISVIGRVAEPEAVAPVAPPEPSPTPAAAVAPAQAPAATQFYVIQKGDTLSAIAKQYYGAANKYPKLFEANREVIEDPDRIYPGQKIRIPPLA